jgi:hypothetical protein
MSGNRSVDKVLEGGQVGRMQPKIIKHIWSLETKSCFEIKAVSHIYLLLKSS